MKVQARLRVFRLACRIFQRRSFPFLTASGPRNLQPHCEFFLLPCDRFLSAAPPPPLHSILSVFLISIHR